jgi:hypothetical protein
MKLRMKVTPRLILISSVITPKTTTGALAPVVVLGGAMPVFIFLKLFYTQVLTPSVVSVEFASSLETPHRKRFRAIN